MTGAGADWPAIAGEVAEALLGEPSSRTGRELRFGRRGSLSVRLDTGTWHDHEAGEGGGVLDLVIRERRCDTAAALVWLESGGFVGGPERRCAAFSGPAAPAVPPAPPNAAPVGAPDARAALAARLWAASGPADSTAGRVYLARRCTWPPAGIGPDLPAAVRWLPAELARFRDESVKWYGLPAGAAGALAFAWRTLAGELAAVSLLAVSAAGERVTWFGDRAVRVRAVGSRTGAVFVARPGEPGADLQIAEGEADALACVLAPWVGPGAVYAVGGTAGMVRAAALGSGAVVVHADGDPGGRGAVERARHAIAESGRAVRIEWYSVGTDPGDALAGWIAERAAIREHDGGEDRHDADCRAWAESLAQGGMGTPARVESRPGGDRRGGGTKSHTC